MERVQIAAILPKGKLFDRMYAEGLVAAARASKAELERVGTEFSKTDSLEIIREKIERSSLIIADVTARNPNVLFLAGLALGLGKKMIFIAQHGEDFPLADTDEPPIIYGSDAEFLKREIASYLGGTPRNASHKEESPRAKFLATFGDLMKKHQQEHRGEIQMENPTTFVLVDQTLDLALVQDLARRGRELGLRIKLM